MKVVIAPQGFKGNLSASEVGQAIVNGIRRVSPDIETIIKPMADGGEGTLDVLVQASGGKYIIAEVTGPLGEPVIGGWGFLGDDTTAVVEMAKASGISLVPTERLNPLTATTYGTGELIKSALDYGCNKIIVGVGGSATNDGGVGMAQALEVRFLDSQGVSIQPGGETLSKLEHIDISGKDPRLDKCEIILASDVSNPLCGDNGASVVYGPQKGATPEMVKVLDGALAHYADVIYRELGIDARDYPGAGAAGGLGIGLMVFLGAKMVPGVEIVIQLSELEKDFEDADLVFTAEGRIDNQTAYGKTPIGVAQKAKEYGLPVVVLAGDVTDDYQAVYQHGIDAVFSIAPGPISLTQSMERAEQLIVYAAESATRLFISRDKPYIS